MYRERAHPLDSTHMCIESASTPLVRTHICIESAYTEQRAVCRK